MEILGKLYGVAEAKVGIGRESGKQWISQDFELKTFNRGSVENIIRLNAWGQTCEELSKCQIGDIVKCEIQIRGKEYNGKRYNEIECSYITRIS